MNYGLWILEKVLFLIEEAPFFMILLKKQDIEYKHKFGGSYG